MQEFNQIFNNNILIVSIAACLMAQLLKLIIELIRHRKVNLKYLVTTGGMPSAHSALVSSLATGVGIKEGWNSSAFAIACLFAVIVMYDAAGVRQAAGKQARILNQILDGFFQDGKEVDEERLKELLGHTPFQVLVGLVLGVGISFVAAPAL
jgi:acid phosphatase family membrane protein YuiD